MTPYQQCFDVSPSRHACSALSPTRRERFTATFIARALNRIGYDTINNMQLDNLQFLRLLQLADSALPIGTTAHSFGLETLAVEEYLEPPQLELCLGEYMYETGVLETVFCRLAHRLVVQYCEDEASLETGLGKLNTQLDAYKTARESRSASTTLGRRFLQLVLSLTKQASLSIALRQAKEQGGACHYCTAFGLTGAVLGIDEDTAVLAYLYQSLASLISACQRLLPLGQSQASAVLWRLKPILMEVATVSEGLVLHPESIAVCIPLLDLGSMRHPYLVTRLFIS
jgi:urease accessory protein